MPARAWRGCRPAPFATAFVMKLLSLLRTQLQKRTVGTLVLGKRQSFREIFFERELVYLADETFSGKIDMEGLVRSGVMGSRLSLPELESILAAADLKVEILPQILLERGLIDQSILEELASSHIQEEVLELLMHNTESFHFQEGRVPELLLRADGLAVNTPASLQALIKALERRAESVKSFEEILPSREEVFVLTAEGMAYKQAHPEDYGLERLCAMIDGFRNLESLIEHSRYFQHYLLFLIVTALERGHLKKAVLPEIKGISTSQITPEDASRYLPYFKNAVKYAVDQLGSRERLALVYESLGNREEAVVQYNFIGDVLCRMGKASKAVQSYHRALSLKPGDALIGDKIVHIYKEAAEQELLRHETQQAVQLLESALRVRPDDPTIVERLIDIHSQRGGLKELGELCDTIITYARKSGDSQPAVAACRQVLARFPHHPAFQRKLVNIYLDFHQTEMAAAEMARLATEYLERGQPERALELFGKIRRAGKMTSELERLQKAINRRLGGSEPVRKRKGAALALSLGLLSVFLIYQLWSYVAWRNVRGQGAALAQAAIALDAASAKAGGTAPQVSLRPSAEENANLEIASNCERFVRQFPISIFRGKAEEIARRSHDHAGGIAASRAETMERLLTEAARLASEGSRQELLAMLQPILELAESDPDRRRAIALVKGMKTHDRSAPELFEAGRQLEAAGDYRGAYRAYRQLLEHFPHSHLAGGIVLPVLVESLPRGAQVHRVSGPSQLEPLGKTPLVLRIAPEVVVVVELSAPGHHGLRTEVDQHDGEYNLLILLRRELWSFGLDGRAYMNPFFAGNLLLCPLNGGSLQAVDLDTRAVAWSLRRGALENLVGPPLSTTEGFYTVWNDSTVLLLERASADQSASVRQAVKIEGFATTPLLQLGKELIVLGTSRNLLQMLERGSLRSAGQVAVDGTPVTLASLDPATVLFTTSKGALAAVGVPAGGVVWKRDLAAQVSRPPELVGSSVAVLAQDRTLYLLEPRSGAVRVELPVGRGDQVFWDASGSRIYLLQASGWLAAISAETGQTLSRRHLRLQATGAAAFGDSVAIIHNAGTGILVLDARSLEPRWATQTAAAAERLASDGKHFVIVTADNRLLVYAGGEQ
jgi:tetratricopeptide (TPR) repeat protein/outer membrane protein assembly factor BamB